MLTIMKNFLSTLHLHKSLNLNHFWTYSIFLKNCVKIKGMLVKNANEKPTEAHSMGTELGNLCF